MLSQMLQSLTLNPVTSGSLLNLIICALVVGCGLYWFLSLKHKWRGAYRFIYRGYVYWWTSWAVWLIAWSLITFGMPPGHEWLNNFLSLVASDLNGILIILVYFSLTRGNEFGSSAALRRGGLIVLALAAYYGALYVLFERDIALQLHERWSLCIGVVSQILLGWAIALRFNAKAALIFGYVYGFAQPAVYEAALHAEAVTKEVVKEAAQLNALVAQVINAPGVQITLNRDDLLHQMEAANKLTTSFVVVLIVLAFLKLSLATIVTRYFTQTPETTSSLVNESAAVSAGQPPSDWKKALYAQLVVLLAFFTGAFLYLKPVPLLIVVEVLCLLAVFFLIILGLAHFSSFWRRYLRPAFDWLRGADGSDGAAQEMNEAARAVAVESYDVFLSYSSEDEKEAKAIGEVIEIAGRKVFFARAALTAGEHFDERIRDAISSCREFWLLASANSLQSEWVRRERDAAWALKKTIVPILHNCRPEELPNDISGIHFVEFDDYRKLIKKKFARGRAEMS
jgi:hypothetical protein